MASFFSVTRLLRGEHPPYRTMAIWLALVALVFLTRDRWEAWVVEQELPNSTCFAWYPPVSPDGRYLVMADSDHFVLWDLEARQAVADIEEYVVSPNFDLLSQNMNCFISFSRDGKRCVFVGCPASTVSAWGRVPYPQEDGAGYVAVVVDTETGAVPSVLDAHADSVFAVVCSPDGSRVVTLSRDGSVRVWNAESGKIIRVLQKHEKAARAAFSGDGELLLAWDSSGAVYVYDVLGGERLVSINAGTLLPFGFVRFCYEDKRIAAQYGDKEEMKLWDARSGALVAVLPSSIPFLLSKDGEKIATMLPGQPTVRIVDAGTGAELATLQIEQKHRSDMLWILPHDFSPDASLIVTESSRNWFHGRTERSGDQKTLDVWDAGTGKCLVSIPIPGGEIEGVKLVGPTPGFDGVEFTEEGHRIIAYRVGEYPAGVWIYDSCTGELLAEIAHQGRCYPFLGERRLLVTAEEGISRVFRRLRPEWWWGVFCLWHFWAIVALLGLLAWSVLGDSRALRARREQPPTDADGRR
jgi:WD40 repeat protein